MDSYALLEFMKAGGYISEKQYKDCFAANDDPCKYALKRRYITKRKYDVIVANYQQAQVELQPLSDDEEVLPDFSDLDSIPTNENKPSSEVFSSTRSTKDEDSSNSFSSEVFFEFDDPKKPKNSKNSKNIPKQGEKIDASLSVEIFYDVNEKNVPTTQKIEITPVPKEDTQDDEHIIEELRPQMKALGDLEGSFSSEVFDKEAFDEGFSSGDKGFTPNDSMEFEFLGSDSIDNMEEISPDEDSMEAHIVEEALLEDPMAPFPDEDSMEAHIVEEALLEDPMAPFPDETSEFAFLEDSEEAIEIPDIPDTISAQSLTSPKPTAKVENKIEELFDNDEVSLEITSSNAILDPLSSGEIKTLTNEELDSETALSSLKSDEPAAPIPDFSTVEVSSSDAQSYSLEKEEQILASPLQEKQTKTPAEDPFGLDDVLGSPQGPSTTPTDDFEGLESADSFEELDISDFEESAETADEEEEIIEAAVVSEEDVVLLRAQGVPMFEGEYIDEEESPQEMDDAQDFEDLGDFESLDSILEKPKDITDANIEISNDFDDLGDFEDLNLNGKNFSEAPTIASQATPAIEEDDDFSNLEMEDFSNINEMSSPQAKPLSNQKDDFSDLGDFEDFGSASDEDQSTMAVPADSGDDFSDLGELGDFSDLDSVLDGDSEEDSVLALPADSGDDFSDLGEFEDLGAGASEQSTMAVPAESADDFSDLGGFEDFGSASDEDQSSIAESADDFSDLDSVLDGDSEEDSVLALPADSGDDFSDLGDFEDLGAGVSEQSTMAVPAESADDFSDLGEFGDLDFSDFENFEDSGDNINQMETIVDDQSKKQKKLQNSKTSSKPQKNSESNPMDNFLDGIDLEISSEDFPSFDDD